MKIALVAPVEESVPPRKYGGIEQVVHLLDGQLGQLGHDIFLLASGGSDSLGRLIPLTDEPLSAGGRDLETGELVACKEAAAERAAWLLAVLQPDIVLNHSWRLLDHAGSITLPVLTTIHYPLDAGPYRRVFLERPQGTYVSVSLSQQRAVESLSFAGNVYNGVDLEALPFSSLPDGYFAFLGRVSPDKGLDIAIRVAQDVCVPLKIAAKLDGAHRPWFDMVVAPLLERGGAEFMGEVDTAGRAALLGGRLPSFTPRAGASRSGLLSWRRWRAARRFWRCAVGPLTR